jgi:hypothetical protein
MPDSVFTRYLRGRKQEAAAADGKLWFLSAWALSVIFHPLLIPTYSTLLMFRFGADFLPLPAAGKWALLIFLFAGTFLIPLAGIILLWSAGLIASLSMEERKDRHLPHLLAFSAFLGTAFLLVYFLPGLALPGLLLLASAISVGITGLITLYWKISSHLVGMGGFLGFQLALAGLSQSQDFLLPIVLSILLCVALAASRRYLKAHDNLQLLAGFFLGMVISSLTVSFFAEFFL